MGLMLGHDSAVAAWVGAKIDAEAFPPFTAIGIASDDEALQGGIIFHDWNGSNLELTVALDRPLKRSEIRGIRHYVFDQLGAKRVTFRTLEGNTQARRFLDRHATFEAMLPDWFSDGAAAQYRILRNDLNCLRWKVLL